MKSLACHLQSAQNLAFFLRKRRAFSAIAGAHGADWFFALSPAANMQNDLVRSMNVTYRNIIAVRWPQLMAFSINYATLFLLSALSIPLNFSRPRCRLLIIFGTRSECPAPRARDAFSFPTRFLLRELSRNSFKPKTCFLSSERLYKNKQKRQRIGKLPD
jgi:hypothetical protein